ncbi:MAG: hypothetical protein FWC28_09165 [Proteobacteria bacterium]|nr:hypothetical protein [Cystobacterineae bacterium]MCL2258234.1 hypothetical protein [Cystobacterineae bacterium]MCL2315395.1 hypothetical protein [Pseudomonadota bacterium]
MSWKAWVTCGFLCVIACKKESTFLSSSEILQKMEAREKALSSFSIQVHTEEEGGAIEHTVIFRAPELIRVEIEQPRKLSLGFDGRNYYRLEASTKKLRVLSLKLPAAERKLALSKLLGVFIPEGFQLPKVMPKELKQSWLEPQGTSRILRLENRLSEEVTTAYVVRWPSFDFLKKEVWVEGRQMEFVMQEEHCLPGGGLCFPTLVMAKQGGEVLGPQKIGLFFVQEAVSNEHFLFQAPEGFAVEKHSVASLEELELFLRSNP